MVPPHSSNSGVADTFAAEDKKGQPGRNLEKPGGKRAENGVFVRGTPCKTTAAVSMRLDVFPSWERLLLRCCNYPVRICCKFPARLFPSSIFTHTRPRRREASVAPAQYPGGAHELLRGHRPGRAAHPSRCRPSALRPGRQPARDLRSNDKQMHCGRFHHHPTRRAHCYDVAAPGEKALLLTFDAPPYDPKKTVNVEPKPSAK